MKISLVPCFLLFLSACASDGSEGEEEEKPPVIDCSSVQTVPKFSQVQAFQAVCTHCHSTQNTGASRNEAPAEINFDDYASAFAHARQASIEVNVSAMPPASSGLSLTAAQKTELYAWALCGAPQ
jgi:uncharacterized membrane protein